MYLSRDAVTGVLVMESRICYLVSMVKFICAFTKIGSLAPRSTLRSKNFICHRSRAQKFLRTDKSQGGI